VRPADRKDRVDPPQLPLVTIDGETASGFRRRVYCERKGGTSAWSSPSPTSALCP
jgi:exoribonuclease R